MKLQNWATLRSESEEILPNVETWLQKVSSIQEERSGIETEILNVKSGCLAIKSRFLLSRKATKMAAAMKVLLDDGKFERIANPAPPAAVAPIPDGQTYELESRKHLEENIMAALRKEKNGMMGICGMGGVGKTTMAKNIMRKARGECLFAEIVMVVVSQPVNISRIQQEMAELLDLILKGETVPARAHQLRTSLKSTKSILIILDDLWEGLDLEDLGIPHQRDLKECVILLTSRNTHVFKEMNVKKSFQMKTLEAEEAWSLFKEKVGACADDQSLFSTAQEIVRECNGLPIALVTVGVALKDQKNEAIWKNAQRELKRGYPQGISGFLAKVYNPLKLSYDLLEDKEAKSLFLLCCLFPEDYNIRLYDLCLYVWGLNMFERITCLQDARNKVQATIETLKSRSLLLNGRSEAFTKMHDVVRDVGIFIAAQEKLIDHNLDCTWISSFHQLPEEKTTLPKILLPRGPFLLILKSIKPHNAWEELQLFNIFDRARELSVLSMEEYKMRSLPNTIQLLQNLRTLILISCESLEDISIVGKLASLEIFYCYGLWKIKELPIEIGSLSQLKLLHIEKCSSLTIAARVISKLVGLEELTLIDSFEGWESGASEGKNAGLCELNCLTSLTTLRIQIEDASLAAEQIHLPDLVEFDIIIGICDEFKISYGKQMWLKLERDVIIGEWIHQLLRTTESLYLHGEGSSKLVPLFCNLSSITTTVFPLLESLCLNYINDLEEIPSGLISSDSFKNLQEIRLSRLSNLQRLWDVVPLFCNLSSITIISCQSLRSLFPWTTENDHLIRLKSIDIRDCSMLEQVLMWDEEGSRQINHNHRRITFPKLKHLDLFDLPRLTSFCKGIQSIEFPLLTSVEIVKCPNLKSLVSSTDDDSLHLFCRSDQAAFDRLGRLEIGGYDSIESLVSFTRLGSLSLSNCGKIKSLFSLSIASNLVHLWELLIESCGEMIKMTEDKVDEVERCPFINLKVLKLINLPKLKAFCDCGCALELPSLRQMCISKCPLLEKLSFVSITSPISSYSFENLESIEIMDCSMLEQVVLWNEEENGQDMNERRITFPKLENLHLHVLPRLISFCKGIQSIEFPRLIKMEIKKCPSLESLEIAFGGLEHLVIGGLEHLVIDECENFKSLFSPSAAGNLVNLRHLTIKKCPDLESLETAFGGLEHLVIDGCENFKSLFSPSTAGNLVNLRDLTIKKCPDLESLETTFDGLEHLVIDGCENFKSFFSPSTAGNLVNLRDLTIERVSFWSDQILMDFFPQLVELKVCNCGNIKSLFSPSIARNLVNLKKLSIVSCCEMVKVIEDEEVKMSPFSKLEVLALIELPKLKAFWRCALHLPSLRKVSISKCPWMEIFSIRSIISPISLDSFENLESLSIMECSMLEQVVLWNEEENGKEDINGQSNRITFPQLKKLNLHDIPRLTSFCKGIQSIEFPLLTKMAIVRCPNLKSLVSSKENDKRCPGAINYDADDSLLPLFCKSQARFGRPERLVIEGYENICSKRSVSLCCDQIPVDFFTGLSVLWVNDCGNIKSLFSSSIAGNLVNLSKLTIESCSEMVKVIEEDEFEMSPFIKLRELTIESCGEMAKAIEDEEVEMSPFIKLKRLHLKKLPKLTAFCDWKCALYLPSLVCVEISECPELERFSFGSLTTPNLQVFIKDRDISHYEKDLNDALNDALIRGDSLHLDILFGTDH